MGRTNSFYRIVIHRFYFAVASVVLGGKDGPAAVLPSGTPRRTDRRLGRNFDQWGVHPCRRGGSSIYLQYLEINVDMSAFNNITVVQVVTKL